MILYKYDSSFSASLNNIRLFSTEVSKPFPYCVVWNKTGCKVLLQPIVRLSSFKICKYFVKRVYELIVCIYLNKRNCSSNSILQSVVREMFE